MQNRIVLVLLAALGALVIAVPATAFGTRVLLESEPDGGPTQEADDLARRQEIRTWLLAQASGMLLARKHGEWREADFDAAPCDETTLSSVHDTEARMTLQTSCERMDAVQSEHTLDCTGENGCMVPYEARARIDGVIHILNLAAQRDLEDR